MTEQQQTMTYWTVVDDLGPITLCEPCALDALNSPPFPMAFESMMEAAPILTALDALIPSDNPLVFTMATEDTCGECGRH